MPVPPALSGIAERFARFRREHPQRTRVPTDLREAILAALRKGVTAGQLQRACGVSRSQIAAWQQAMPRSASAKRRRTAAENVRVFSVVDEVPVPPHGTAALAGHELVLQLGPWSVSVGLASSTRAGRG